jgi:hypothetical protein
MDEDGYFDAAAKSEQAQGLPQPAGGRKEYTGQDGQVTKVVGVRLQAASVG